MQRSASGQTKQKKQLALLYWLNENSQEAEHLDCISYLRKENQIIPDIL
jgi:hypothetical protein